MRDKNMLLSLIDQVRELVTP